MLTNTLIRKQDWPPAVEQDQYGDEQHQRRKNKDTDHRTDHVEYTLQNSTPTVQARPLDTDNRRASDRLYLMIDQLGIEQICRVQIIQMEIVDDAQQAQRCLGGQVGVELNNFIKFVLSGKLTQVLGRRFRKLGNLLNYPKTQIRSAGKFIAQDRRDMSLADQYDPMHANAPAVCLSLHNAHQQPFDTDKQHREKPAGDNNETRRKQKSAKHHHRQH